MRFVQDFDRDINLLVSNGFVSLKTVIDGSTKLYSVDKHAGEHIAVLFGFPEGKSKDTELILPVAHFEYVLGSKICMDYEKVDRNKTKQFKKGSRLWNSEFENGLRI